MALGWDGGHVDTAQAGGRGQVRVHGPDPRQGPVRHLLFWPGLGLDI